MTEKKAERKRGLGRGLSALIGEAAPVGTNTGANLNAGAGDVSFATTGNGLRPGRFSHEKILTRVN